MAQSFVQPILFPALGIGHQLSDGARRRVEAVTDAALTSGVFYASAANKITGPVLDQASIAADLGDTTIQDNADEAIHRFIR